MTFSLDGTLSFEGVALDSVAVVDFTVVVVGAESWDLLSGGTADEFWLTAPPFEDDAEDPRLLLLFFFLLFGCDDEIIFVST